MRLVPKTRVKLFQLSFSTGSASRNSQSKKVESKKPFVDCVKKPDLGFSRKRPFSTDKSDRLRNGLTSGMYFDFLQYNPWRIFSFKKKIIHGYYFVCFDLVTVCMILMIRCYYGDPSLAG